MELASKYGEGPISLKSIAEKHQLSEHYLEQLVAPLRNAGLVKSIRGAYGGYILPNEPESITAGKVIRILEGLERVGLLPGEDARLLQDIYKAYRSAAHRQALQKQPGVVSGGQFAEERRMVMRIWQELGLS